MKIHQQRSNSSGGRAPTGTRPAQTEPTLSSSWDRSRLCFEASSRCTEKTSVNRQAHDTELKTSVKIK
ncbi:hypothetical protein EYF80_042072 [Liparis tanakae]|uniref:Uncharacterized protein n=1 Tax=Liparis tanakae TaxID=230148 RepID=A0A4Z2G4D8_9TELE|nr:hypothetical protein EYF80_042072 [Liparis tanakae]